MSRLRVAQTFDHKRILERQFPEDKVAIVGGTPLYGYRFTEVIDHTFKTRTSREQDWWDIISCRIDTR